MKYHIIPDEAYRRLSSDEIKVLHAILSLADEDGKAHISIRFLADKTGFSKSKIQRMFGTVWWDSLVGQSNGLVTILYLDDYKEFLKKMGQSGGTVWWDTKTSPNKEPPNDIYSNPQEINPSKLPPVLKSPDKTSLSSDFITSPSGGAETKAELFEVVEPFDEIDNNEAIEVKPKSQRKIIPPKREWVEKYIREQNYHFSVDEFMDHYTSNGWMVGRTKMKDWQAACRTFERNAKTNKYGNNRAADNFTKLEQELAERTAREFEQERSRKSSAMPDTLW